MKNRLGQLIGSIFMLGATSGAAHAGTWQPVTTPAPIEAGTALLLMNGNVMVQDVGGSDWWLLKPDGSGSYVNGSWSQIASLPVINGVQYAPEYYASAVLPDGKVLIMGGEYNGDQYVSTNVGALYDPVANNWTPVGAPTDSAGPWPRVGDAASVVLPNGTFMLQCGYCGAASGAETALFNEATLSWTIVPGNGMAFPYQDEQSYTLLPDGTVLTVDIWDSDPRHAEKFYLNQWISAGDTTQVTTGGLQLCGTSPLKYCSAYEIGPAVLRADGTVIQFGATGYNSIYHPPTSPSQPGAWSNAPSFPTYTDTASDCWQGTPRFDVADGPAALLPTGNVLVAASPGTYCQPLRFYELNATGRLALTQVAGTPHAPSLSSFEGVMLVLPTGQILFTDQTSDVEIYTAAGTVSPHWPPNIWSVPGTITRGTTYTVTGARFNGMSQGAMYGDDVQTATNYPLVRVTSQGGGNVYYCTTSNPSTMAVATGTKQVSVRFACGANVPAGSYGLQVIASGLASASMPVALK